MGSCGEFPHFHKQMQPLGFEHRVLPLRVRCHVVFRTQLPSGLLLAGEDQPGRRINTLQNYSLRIHLIKEGSH